MISKKSVDLRPNWEARVSTKGFNPERWAEGSMVTISDSPGLVDALIDFASKVPDRINELFRDGNPLKMPTFGAHRPEHIFNAASRSWAHQDPGFPLRFDIGVTKLGCFSLIAVKGDCLKSAIPASTVSKAWHQHHFEGMSNFLEVNFLSEHLTSELQPFGSHSSPPSIQEVTVLSEDSRNASYMVSCVGNNSGLRLSEVGTGTLEDIDKLKISEGIDGKSVIKIDSWADILKTVDSESAWFDLFDTPRSFTFPPPWVLALDEMIDFSEKVEEDPIELVLNIWLSINTRGPVPLIVASEYKPDYRFEDAVIIPVVLEVKEPELSE